MMLVNFLDHKYGPKVAYDCVCDSKPENLLARDATALNEGFMAYSATKPPMELNFEVLALIRVDSIRIVAQIGGLKSTAFEVWAKRSSSDYQKVGQAYLETHHIGVLFYQRSRTERSAEAQHIFETEFWTNSSRILNACQFIKIVIKRTNSCAPVMKVIQIWGQPARECSVETRNLIISLSTTSAVPSTSEIQPERSPSEDIQDSEDTSASDLSVPDDFLDALTFNIMALPMTLPSGKVIDQTTLEKHNKHEENWGRLPCDPFTGRLYTKTHRPLLDSALKARIDLFLLHNANHEVVKATPRTTGRLKKRGESYVGSTTKQIKLDSGSDGLDAAVQRALTQITRFSRPTAPRVGQPQSLECGACKRRPDYRIVSCQHLCCKGCLAGLGEELVCFSCKVSFNKSDIQRFHSC